MNRHISLSFLTVFTLFSTFFLSVCVAQTSETETVKKIEHKNLPEYFGFQFEQPQKSEESQASVLFQWSNDTQTELPIRVFHEEHTLMTDARGRKKGEKITLSDAGFRVGQFRYFVRPFPQRFHSSYSVSPLYKETLDKWESFGKVEQVPLHIVFHKIPHGIEVFLNGAYAGEIVKPDAEITACFTVLKSDAVTLSRKDAFSRPTGTLFPLDFEGNRNIRKLAENENLALRTNPLGSPAPKTLADVANCREGQGNWALEVDEYLARSPLDGFPYEIHFQVPAKPYHAVRILFTLDEDTRKVPVLTTRLAQYKYPGIGGNGIADTVRIFDEEGLRDCQEVGTLTKNGKTQKVYYARIPLEVGKVLDFVAGREWNMSPKDEPKPKYLDVEFLGKCKTAHHQENQKMKPDPDFVSSVQILGATLEIAPVTLDFEQVMPGNVFYDHEKSETVAVLRANRNFDGKLRWTVTDFQDGNEESAESESVSMTESTPFSIKTGETRRITVPLKPSAGKHGYFDIRFEITSQNEAETFYAHDASFVILPPDDRRALTDSPFGLWWFDGAHWVTNKIEYVGPLFLRAGVRRMGAGSHTEAEGKPYKMFKMQANLTGDFRLLNEQKNGLTPEACKKLDAHMKKLLTDYPHLNSVCIYHESGPGFDIPWEIFGEKTVLTPEQDKNHRRYGALYNAVGKFMREKYPNIRLVVGNSSGSAQTIGAIFRFGGDPRYIDYIGNESTGMEFIPERLCEYTAQAQHLARAAGRVFTGKDFPVTSCYEFIYRTDHTLGRLRQAQWYTRDMLITLANGWENISPGLIIDAGNAYGNSLWGSSGIMQKSPYTYPKPAYAAYATLTRVMDQAKFSRQLDTLVPTVYAVEFRRPNRQKGDGPYVYALWTARGKYNAKFRLPEGSRCQKVALFGQISDTSLTPIPALKQQEGTLTFSESPQYLLTDQPLTEIELTSTIRSESDLRRAETAEPIATFTNSSQLAVVADTEIATQFKPGNIIHTPVRRSASAQLSTVLDGEKGACVALTPDFCLADFQEKKPVDPKFPTELVADYVRLEVTPAANAQKFPADRRGIGLWVYGNANWGNIMFELKDADGEIWRSIGESDWGCTAFDWPGHASVNFEGWNFVSVPLQDTDAYDVYGPSGAKSQWRAFGPGNRKMDGPLTLRAIYIETYRHRLNLRDFTPTKTGIKIGECAVF